MLNTCQIYASKAVLACMVNFFFICSQKVPSGSKKNLVHKTLNNSVCEVFESARKLFFDSCILMLGT